jgi:hypothetical protein
MSVTFTTIAPEAVKPPALQLYIGMDEYFEVPGGCKGSSSTNHVVTVQIS